MLKGVTERVQNEVKEHKGGFLSMSLGTLCTSLLGNILVGKGINSAGKGRGINRPGEGALARRQGRGIARAGYVVVLLKKWIFNVVSSFDKF